MSHTLGYLVPLTDKKKKKITGYKRVFSWKEANRLAKRTKLKVAGKKFNQSVPFFKVKPEWIKEQS